MRMLKSLLKIVVVLMLLLVGGAYLLPREVTVERVTVMNASAEEIFPHVNSMKASEGWSPWLGHDPDALLEYSGPDEGVGSMLTWSSDHPNVGSGTNTITESVEFELVKSALDFGDMGTAEAWFILADADGGTEVTWGLTTDMGMNPIGRWMGLMMDKWIGADYEIGLTNLKMLVEGG